MKDENKEAKKFPCFLYISMITFISYIGEAISMADRIVILTGRPAMVKKIMEVKLTNSSTPINNRKCVEFSKYYESIWKELDFHV